MSTRVVIVGAGLFGMIAARLAHERGADVLIIDRAEPLAGSKAAACLMRPSWLSKLAQNGKDGLAVLDRLYGLRTIRFKAGPIYTDVHWVPPSEILTLFPQRRVYGNVINIHPEYLGVLTGFNDERTVTQIAYDKLLIATGAWACELAETPPIDALMGHAQIYRGQLQQPFIRPWAPYKQIVGFNVTPSEVWCGDGGAILKDNWTEERTKLTRERCNDQLPLDVMTQHHRTLEGYRPYVKGHGGGYFRQLRNKVWVSTGGAKNGTVLAAYQAKLFADAALSSG